MDFHTNKFIIIPSLYLKSNSHSDFPSVSSTFCLNPVSESITPHRLAAGITWAKPEGWWLDINGWGWARTTLGGQGSTLQRTGMWPRLDQASPFTVEFSTGRMTNNKSTWIFLVLLVSLTCPCSPESPKPCLLWGFVRLIFLQWFFFLC